MALQIPLYSVNRKLKKKETDRQNTGVGWRLNVVRAQTTMRTRLPEPRSYKRECASSPNPSIRMHKAPGAFSVTVLRFRHRPDCLSQEDLWVVVGLPSFLNTEVGCL
jgi:hypothetical protein